MLDTNESRIHYRLDGPADGPVLVLSHSLGTDLSLWSPQMPVLSERFRTLRYDTRGHGQSSHGPELFTIERLAEDVVRLLNHIQAERVSFCGLSMGGMIGMVLGVAHAERIDKLVLCNTAAQIGTDELWNARIAAARTGGTSSIAEPVLQRWFMPQFREKYPDVVDSVRQVLLNTSAEGYARCCIALRDADFRRSIAAIRRPVLIVAGSYDPATTTEDARFLSGNIANSKYVELPAAHLSNIEAAESFNRALCEFLA
jgi:3-oxoadipate enol-lactonase